jgi:hypothetical protein
MQEQKALEVRRLKEQEAFTQQLNEERQKMHAELQQQLRKNIASDYENELRRAQAEHCRKRRTHQNSTAERI